MLRNCGEDKLREAMEYSVFAGGKRLRPLLLLAACESVKGEYTPDALDFACAAEMIHTYSLIHDDLPAMDNDDYRRGKPTNHKVHGEALAILAGDALLNRAFETMALLCSEKPLYVNLQAMCHITAAAGDNGMIAGQAADMLFQHKETDAGTLINIHRHKTGALFEACLTAGAILGGADSDCQTKMQSLGASLGLLFQIQDDILDVVSSADIIGKSVGSDQKNQKNTFVSVYGLEKTQAECKKYTRFVLAELNHIPQKTSSLSDLVQRLINREK